MVLDGGDVSNSESFGLSLNDAQIRRKSRGNWLTQICLEKWPLKWCVRVCVCLSD